MIRRSNFLINKKFQFSILGWFFLLSCILILIFYCAQMYFLQEFVKLGTEAGLPREHVFFSFLEQQRIVLNRLFVGATLGTLLTLGLGGLYLSHKIAGPIYKLTQHLKATRVSDLKPVKFRKGDYFPELEEAFNELVSRK